MVIKNTKWFYLQPFLFSDEALHLLDISRKLNENHTTVRNHLNNFVKEGLLKVYYKGRMVFYKINFDFPLVVDYLSIAEKEFLITKCNLNKIFRELIFDVQMVSSKPVVFFGSSVKNFLKAEDIDLITLEELKLDELNNKYNKEFHVLRVSSLKKISVALRNEILKKHVIVNGVEEVVKWLRLVGV